MMATRADARRRPRLALCLVAMALAACTQGYPQDDVPQVSALDMSNDERLAALNGMAREARAAHRWRYAMAGTCELRIESRSKGSRPSHTTLTLVPAMDADLAFDKQEQAYDVVIRASSARDAQVVATVMKGREWTQASKAALYLKLLIRDCARAAP